MPNSTAKYRTNAKKSKKKKRKRPFFFNVPSWIRWVGGILLTAVFIGGLYFYLVRPYITRWKGVYGEVLYPANYDIRGIDISHHQGKIDWKRLRNAQVNGTPLRFIFVKATEGTSLLDRNFKYNYSQAHENNFITGAYHFFTPNKPAADQARYFIKKVKFEKGDLPPVLDIEMKGKLTNSQIKEAALEWLRIVENACGTKPIIYTNYGFKLKYLNDEQFKKYPYWIAHYYVEELKFNGPWRFWQHTDFGKVDGIKGNVDINVYNGSMYELKKLCIGANEEIE